jgi:signal transduction histidine kinase/DNA-binding response OmpR family regulator
VTPPLLTLRIRQEPDIVLARQRARQVAAILGFDSVEQTRIATAVSELARNAFKYAGGGSISYGVEGKTPPQVFTIAVTDSGPGIADLELVLSGAYRSETGMGLGLVGTRRLVDRFEIVSTSAGTTVTIKKLMPRRAPFVAVQQLDAVARRLAQERPEGPVEEVQRQNQELLRTLEELRTRQEDLERVNLELEDTNRGVVALYAELDERADHLRRADELKTKFLSNMTHEFRTPVNSILALTSLLAERLGSGADQKDEVFYIRKSAQQLSDLVDDLLDIAKVEAGKIEVRPAPFEVEGLFGALRGMLRPLLINQSLALVFEDVAGLPPILSDEHKVSQILRNFISNALKYTERGEVRVRAAISRGRDAVMFSVADTGIGIPAQDLARVFDEFVQIENPLQRRTKGTGLGLPLSRRLAELLGGSVAVESTLGLGSTFSLTIPLVYRDAAGAGPIRIQPGRVPILVVEDSDEDMLLFERALMGTRYQIVPARSVAAGVAALSAFRPAVLVLDIRLQGQESWDWLARLKRDERTSGIPLVIASTVDDRRKGFSLGADAYIVKPVARTTLLQALEAVIGTARPLRILSVDDEETFRFIIGEMLSGPDYELLFATTGLECLQAAAERPPDVILLDFSLTDMDGAEVIDRLRASTATATIPIIIVTSQRVLDTLTATGRTHVLSKAELTRDRLQSLLMEHAVPSADLEPGVKQS